jgi:chemotaxis receptor (MCP) glutamine deamidase CheD
MKWTFREQMDVWEPEESLRLGLCLEVCVYDADRCFAGLDHLDVVVNHTSTFFHSRAIFHTHTHTHTNQLQQTGGDRPAVLELPGGHHHQSKAHL